MGYATEAILRDLNGDPIPQYFSVADDEFKPLTEDEAEELTVLLDDIKTALEGNMQTALDDIQTAVENLPISSIAEYTWDSGDADPNPGATVRAFGVKHDAGAFTAYYWDGAGWGAI